ncbi:ABC transporter permease [Alsobacter sp. SYSU M60028]|uniref:ABC transporter permease n=1 Tax=Alsobacter ponti TaxID=2962936 RepID=A0ABT1LEG8_9HYPH|nr:ABC transporter permease [Alsobacter ponti]MCP8939493.1 ABC transporter permease [Alsobacter ponti]
MGVTEAILLTVITAATPLLIAALGELVVEKAGVLNLGIEGMMAVGAACGFAAATLSGSSLVGVGAAVLAGLALSAVFALLVLGLATNQVASGLALTIMGLGLSGLIGAGFVGTNRDAIPPVYIPGLTDLPGVGRLLFGESPFVYVSLALALGILWFLGRSRAGLTLRSIGENHVSGHALGLPVLRVRLYAILFGGACAGLAGAYLSLVYTPFWSPGMTAGRGWIALALVVFASWKPLRVLFGAYLFGGATVLQLHLQAASIGFPSQALSAFPYVATILALVVMSVGERKATGAPGSLGAPFVPDR